MIRFFVGIGWSVPEDKRGIEPHTLHSSAQFVKFTANKSHTPTQHKWVTDEHGNQRKVEVAKRVKRWWTASADAKINLVTRYGSKPLEFSEGKNAIELGSEAKVAEGKFG